jgi:preprotein translocase subunit SecD
MQRTLFIKTLVIIGVLVVFLYGIFGVPGKFNGDGIKQAVLDRIHLGLDLKGGMHLILEVLVDEAVNTETDTVTGQLKEQMQKQGITFTDVTKPDAAHPETIVITGVPLDAGAKLRELVGNNLRQYSITSGPNNSWLVTMNPTEVASLKERTIDQSIEAIRNRVDKLGVSEPLIQRNGLGKNQILVQLPGVDDVGRVKEIIQSTARLEIRQAFNDGKPFPNEQAAAGQLLPGRVLIHASSKVGDNADQVYVVSKIPVVSGTDIRDSQQSTDQYGKPNVTFQLTGAAGDKFFAFTSAHNVNSSDPGWLAAVLDNQAIEVASINSAIRDRGEITGGFTDQSAHDLSMLLRSGALPASLHYLSESTVGPSLGADSIRSGVKAAVAGMLAVLVFMLIYYRGAGVNANVALILNLIILLGFMGFFGATLTLPGIAGVILTVGMGVDSNVLIFERIREELRNNKAPAAAVDQGFSRAWITIVDTHVTTIVSALILIFAGSGPVSGFGLTLTFGLVANLFTAVFVSRVIFDTVLSRKQRGQALSI